MKKRILLLIIFLIAMYLRFDAYFINNSFFTDEVLLATNILEKNYLELFFPLNYFQSAPALFLITTKIFTNFLGLNELCFRFLPFISSLASVFIFYKICNKFYNTTLAKLIALFLFGINYHLLFYTQTFKQYSTDVLFTILALYIGNNIKDKTNYKSWTIFGIFALIAVLFSNPLLIVLPAIYLSLIIQNKQNPLKILYSAIYPFVGALIYYFTTLKYSNASLYLKEYWHKGFEIFGFEIYKFNFDFLFNYYSFPLILLILLIVGFFKLYKTKPYFFYSSLFILLGTLFAAGLKIYPFERRLILFLIPILILISVYPIDRIRKNWQSLVILLLSAIFFFTGSFNFAKNFVTGNISYLRQDVKPLLNKLNNNTNIYLYYGSIMSYNHYSLIKKDLPKQKIIVGQIPLDENKSEIYLINDLNKLPIGEYYLLFIKGTWTYEKDLKEFDNWITKKGNLLEDFKLKSARLVKIKK